MYLSCILVQSLHCCQEFPRRAFPRGQARDSAGGHKLDGEVGCVKKSCAPVVHCEYAQAGESLVCLLEESFRLYLIRALVAADSPDVPHGR